MALRSATQRPADAIREVLLNACVAPRGFIDGQYDREVGANTLFDGTFAAAALVRVPESAAGVAMALCCDSRHCALDAKEGAKRAVVEGVARVSAVGATPIGATDCLNFGSPLVPEQMGQLALGVDGIAEACLALDVPVVSGNVSLYNQTDDAAVLPTPTVGIVGVVDDVSKVAPAMEVKAGDVLMRFGAPPTTLSGSLLAWLRARGQGTLPPLDLTAAKALCALVRELRLGGHVLDVFPVLAGGLAKALGTIALGADMPVRATLPEGEDFLVSFLGEDRLTFIAVVDNQGVGAVQALCAKAGIEQAVVGTVGVHPNFCLQDHLGDRRFDVDFAQLVRDLEGVIPGIVGRKHHRPSASAATTTTTSGGGQ